MEDTEIIDLFFARSEEAVSQCQRKYGAYLRTVSGNILGNREDTEEILNDSFLAAWNTIPPRKPPVLKFYLTVQIFLTCQNSASEYATKPFLKEQRLQGKVL